MVRQLLLFLGTLMIAFPCFAQVATPSLDPTQKNEIPSVTPWRYFSTIAGRYGAGAIESESEEGTITSAGAIIALNMEGLGAEFDYNSSEMEFESEESGQTLDVNITSSQSLMFLSYLLNDSFSIGVGQKIETQDIEVVQNDTNLQKESVETTSVTISSNLRLGNIFFLGLGIGESVQTGHLESPFTSVDADYTELKYQYTSAGIGMITGSPGDFQLKAEYSQVSSPEKKEDASGNELAAFHQETDQTTLMVQIKSGTFFAGYTSRVLALAELSAGSTDQEGYETEIASSIYGLGYSPENGLVITFYSETETETAKKSAGDEETDFTVYSVNAGFNF